MEKTMEVAAWARVIGILFWKKLEGEKPYDGFDRYELAGKLIDTMREWTSSYIINMPNRDELGFVWPDDREDETFIKARDLFVTEWNSALEEMETMAESGEMTWDEIWDELRICKNSGRPMCDGFMYCGEYYSTQADLLMEVSWKDYLDAFENYDSDDTMYTEWEGYLRY